MNQYKLGAKKGDGTFSQVFKATSIQTGQSVAIKCMKKHYDSIEKVRKLTEIQALKILSPHSHIIRLIEVLYDEPTGKLALVFELMEQNMYEFLVSNKNCSHLKVKYYMYCLLKAIAFSHKKGIFHRDIKPENVLVSGQDVKLADFGSCKGIYSKHPYTEYISTRWYRAPECLMTDGYYNQKMDIWGYGCVLFEMVSRYPLFNGKNELDQIHKINKIMGTPSDELLSKFKAHASHIKPEEWRFQKHKGMSFSRLLPNVQRELIDLLPRLLAYDPEERISAEEALNHPYFMDLAQSVKIERLRDTMISLSRTRQARDDNNRKTEKPEDIDTKIELATIHIKKDKKERELNGSLPPLNNIKMDLCSGPFNETAISKFKKTNRGLLGKKKI